MLAEQFSPQVPYAPTPALADRVQGPARDSDALQNVVCLNNTYRKGGAAVTCRCGHVWTLTPEQVSFRSIRPQSDPTPFRLSTNCADPDNSCVRLYIDVLEKKRAAGAGPSDSRSPAPAAMCILLSHLGTSTARSSRRLSAAAARARRPPAALRGRRRLLVALPGAAVADGRTEHRSSTRERFNLLSVRCYERNSNRLTVFGRRRYRASDGALTVVMVVVGAGRRAERGGGRRPQQQARVHVVAELGHGEVEGLIVGGRPRQRRHRALRPPRAPGGAGAGRGGGAARRVRVRECAARARTVTRDARTRVGGTLVRRGGGSFFRVVFRGARGTGRRGGRALTANGRRPAPSRPRRGFSALCYGFPWVRRGGGTRLATAVLHAAGARAAGRGTGPASGRRPHGALTHRASLRGVGDDDDKGGKSAARAAAGDPRPSPANTFPAGIEI
ncbi:hypothetical protein EVAR_289_1 [Eumeta japonica]|uniref:Uncharacterized protein n=1 Tax=Eumeta variegata TaxID=151549 RepID=A0A4C1SCM5_EUMVA|nr:hypothetical protein EVAR_289_1 [Eumeta japonica]